ncbi:MAG: flagellar assembly protein FliW [Phycisphaerales bacterium]|jgi:flagellar assembly factor FliW|nr:flagellar assembly protein FliW [Phycisphaerales bacterium]
MEVRTTRFGVITIADDRVITFEKGLLGFSQYTKFCLLEPGEDACFFWLQSIEEPSLAFVVTDPSLFIPEYAVPIRPEQMTDLKMQRLEDAQVFVIVNKVDSTLTGNLQGPLVVNTLNRTGEQLVLAEKRWLTRHPLVKSSVQAPKAISA